MKILVLTKYSLDVTEVKVDSASKELRLSGVPEKIGNIDKNAVEAGVRLQTSAGGSLQALCLGPAAAKDAFKDVLAMGVDEVTLIEDPFAGQADGQTVVTVLAAAIEKLGPFDLILCGFASDDGYSYQVGPRLAERLNLPLISYARQLSLADGKITADRDLDDYQQTVTAALPVIISVAEEAFPPRRTTLMDALKAKKKPVNIWTVPEQLGLNPAELSQSSWIESSSQVGIVVHRKQQIFKGQDQAALADQVIDALLQEKVLQEVRNA